MTNNISNSEQRTTYSEPSPLKLVMLTAIIMFLCIFSSSVVLYAFTQSQARLNTQEQVSILTKQAQVTLSPMLLVKDTLSMNFYLKTLSQANLVSGATLVDNKENTIARAGSPNNTAQKLTLFSNQIRIGELTLFINEKHSSQFFNRLLGLFAMLAGACSIFTLIAIAFFAKKIMREFSQQYKPLLEHRFSLELSQAQTPQESPLIQDIEAPATPTKDASTSPSVSLAIVDLEKSSQASTQDNTPNKSPDASENKALVSLLKPDTRERMPHFKPFSNQADENIKQVKKNIAEPPEIELTEYILPVDPPSASKSSDNPLFRPHPHEEQLDLYSLEHQTELNLNALDAAYVLFIDCSSGRAPIENPQEHKTLLSQYRRLITLVVGIYGGQVELLENGDIRVMFDQATSDDSHGINALCAAKLFNQLYKYYNHRQITRMQPTLNIQISLVRGNKEKIELLREESHFLTRTTQSNELISHTPLSEVPALKKTLLANAQTERQEEDKILILSLSAKHQELLEKQARHLAKSI